MPIATVDFAPGIRRESTAFSEKGRWYDGDKVRFRAGKPEKMGGWVKVTDSTFKGVARTLHNWTLLDGKDCLAIGTHKKIYIEQAGTFYDITPIRYTDTNTDPITTGTAGGTVHTYTTTNPHGAAVGDFFTISDAADVDGICSDAYTNPFRTTAGGSGLVEVSSPTAHFVVAGDTVTFSGTTGFDGIPSGDFNTSHVVLEVTSPTKYLIQVATNATAGGVIAGGSVTAEYLSRLNREFEILSTPTTSTLTFETQTPCTTGGVTGGGTDVVAAFQISIGFAVNITGAGWGAGTWSRGTWGSPVTSSVSNISMRIWSIDNFGEDLIFCPRDGFLYYWDATNGLSTRAVLVSSLAGADSVPTQTSIVRVTDDRHVLAIGATDRNTTAFDPLLIRWCDQEDPANWMPAITNTAGDQRISKGSYVMAALTSRQETLIWTEQSLHSLQFSGPPYTFSLQTLAENTNIAGPNAAANVNNVTYWMGQNQFWVYSGRVEKLPCEVLRYVFEDFNRDQISQVYATTNDAFAEITWFYCSEESDQIDKYVTFNYEQGCWYFGTLPRTAMMQCQNRGGLPYACDGGYDEDDGTLYIHEVGYDDGSTNPPSPITAYVESADFDVAEGNKLIFADRIIPDMTFSRSTVEDPSVAVVITAKKFPGQDTQSADSREISKVVTASVDRYTNQVWARLRGRSMRLRVESNELGVCWLLGSFRVNIRQDGRQ
jgi:hypothetical protein